MSDTKPLPPAQSEGTAQGVGGPVAELLSRECHEGGGTKVINCIVHAGRVLTDRPTDCHLCSTDIQNRLRLAIAVNEWLNQWKDDATELLKSSNAKRESPQTTPEAKEAM